MNRYRPGLGMLIVAATLISGQVWATAGDHGQNKQANPADLTEHYLAIQSALAADSLDQVSEHAGAFKELVAADLKVKDHTDKKSVASIDDSIDRLAKANNLEDARRAFGELSELLVQSDDLLPADQVKVAYCPMAKKHWLQAGDKIANPYYGASMLRCGQFVVKPSVENQTD